MKTIRNSKLAGLIAAAALSVGAVGLIGSPVSADKPVEISPPSQTFTDTNPCTNTEMEVTINLEVRLHVHGDNEVVHVSKTGTTNDGYVMNHGVESFVFNGNVARGSFTDNWTNADGSKFKAQGVFVAKEDGVVVDRFTLRCVGR
jgi:hypothetical protein